MADSFDLLNWEKWGTEAMTFGILDPSTEDAVHEARAGLVSEMGELAGVFQRHFRDKHLDHDKAVRELGDLLWYVVRSWQVCQPAHQPAQWKPWGALAYDKSFEVEIKSVAQAVDFCYDIGYPHMGHGKRIEILHMLARFIGVDLRFAAIVNSEKLRARRARGTIQGSGDER